MTPVMRSHAGFATLIVSLTLALAPACDKGGDKKDDAKKGEDKKADDKGDDKKGDDAPVACGGFAGTPCPDGMTCVDDPSDDCDPSKGGADCIGVCKK